jgi:hypothetical protein
MPIQRKTSPLSRDFYATSFARGLFRGNIYVNIFHRKDDLMLTIATESRFPAGFSQTSEVLTKAVARAAEQLGLSKGMLGRVLGVSPATVTRIYSGDYLLDASRKEWEFALLLVRLFRSLDSIVADETSARAWLASQNSGLNGRPLDLITQTEGLVRVVHYLDASRAVV